MSLELQIDTTPARVTSVNNRTEKHGEDEVIGQDVNLSLSLPLEVLEQFAVDDNPPDWRAFLYAPDGTPRSLSLKPIQSKIEFHEHEVTLAYTDDEGEKSSRRFDDAIVKRFAFTAAAGYRLDASLQVQVHPEDARDMGWLVQLLAAGEATVQIGPPRQTDAFADAAAHIQPAEDRAA